MIKEWPLHEKDITSELCGKCGICCSFAIRPKHSTVDRRYMYFLKATVEKHENIEFIGDGLRITCSHLKDRKCTIYDKRPQLCRDFNCVAWAKVSNNLDQYNRVLKKLGIET